MKKFLKIFLVLIISFLLIYFIGNKYMDLGNLFSGLQEKVLVNINPYCVNIDLTNEESLEYKKIVDGIINQQNEFVLNDNFDNNKLLESIKNNIYYLFISETKIEDNKLYINYIYTLEKQNMIKKDLDNIILDIINENINPEMNDLEKIVSLYKYFYDNYEIDYSSIDNSYYMNISMYEKFTKKLVNKCSLNYLYNFILLELNVDSKILDEDLLFIKINDNYYYFDLWKDMEDKSLLNNFGLDDNTTGYNYGASTDTFSSFRNITSYDIHNHLIEITKDIEKLYFDMITLSITK